MGLKSLPYVNKLQDFNYWLYMWDSTLLYKNYLYLSLFLNKFFNILFNDYSLNKLIYHIININFKKGFLLNYQKINVLFKYILGKIWIFKYQNWYVVIIKIFNLNGNIKKLNYKKFNSWNSYVKKIKFNKNYKFNF